MASPPDYSRSRREFLLRTQQVRRDLADIDLPPGWRRGLTMVVGLTEDVGLQLSDVRHDLMNYEAAANAKLEQQSRRLFGSDDANRRPDDIGAFGVLTKRLDSVVIWVKVGIGVTVPVLITLMGWMGFLVQQALTRHP